jgi:predicted hotdog family 3-hydroxylacyl-ACP dehydratase
MTHDRNWIAAHIPHQGDMCLLDAVDAWDATTIRCTTHTHRLRPHPLAVDGQLGALTAIEYAAQSMAVHGALLAGDQPPRPGLLGSARGVACRVNRLDDIAAPLTVAAECLSADERTRLYTFTVSAGERLLVSGRVAVVFEEAR